MAYKRKVKEVKDFDALMDIVLGIDGELRVSLPSNEPVVILAGSDGEVYSVTEHSHPSLDGVTYRLASSSSDLDASYVGYFNENYRYSIDRQEYYGGPFPLKMFSVTGKA